MAQQYEYAGFWIRTAAAIIDSIIILMALLPLGYIFYGDFRTMGQEVNWTFEIIVQYLLPMVYTVLLWIYIGGTPGKRLFRLKVLDAATGNPVTAGQAVLRYLGYYPAIIVIFIGIIWVAFDAKKQGWHDKMAKTVVVREL